ncbi:MAG: glutamate-5-semialdehyde dehydrogenase [Actinomycetia bacterium]|nr:glutamate-5-semialdehyde dehydrogenase [Actinomycetes bacterium]
MLEAMLSRAKAAQAALGRSATAERDRALRAMAAAVRAATDDILAANREDLARPEAQALSASLRRRLELSAAKLADLADGLEAVAALPDPLGRGSGLRTLPNGLRLEQVRVPLGVIGLIYESRPGVTVEASGLAVKSGNALILRGGREALGSNAALVRVLRGALADAGFDPDVLQLVPDPDRRWATALMHLEGLDLLIPRGGAELIRTVAREATVPVIETGVGNCHLYVDRAADLDMALAILRDGKVGNPAVCNALETLLVHREVAPAFLPRAYERLSADGVRFHGDAAARALVPAMEPATEADWAQEYLDLELAVAVVDSLDQALAHIARYGTRHSEAIVTNDYAAGMRFHQEVDAAVVYWNASTRFTDGFQFGLGAEVGISTQKLHARGPMGLEALTTVKTLAWGAGQTRDLR